MGKGSNRPTIMNNQLSFSGFGPIEILGQDVTANNFQNGLNAITANQP